MKIQLTSTFALLIVLMAQSIFCETGSPGSLAIKTFVKRVSGGGRLVQAIQAENDTYITVTQRGKKDFLVRKTRSTGERVWERTLHFDFSSMTFDFSSITIEGIAQTSDGGYILSGWEFICIRDCEPFDDYSVTHNEGRLVKLQSNGVVEWSKAYSAIGSANFGSVVSDSDGGFTVFDYPGKRIVKFTSIGDVVWTKSFSENAIFHQMGPSLDNGYILVSDSSNGDSPNGADVIKLNNLGTILWKKSLRLEGFAFRTALVTSVHGVVLAFSDGCSQCNKISLVALQRDGSVSWKATYSSDDSVGYDISDLMETPDGGYIIVSDNNRSLLRIDSSQKVVFNTMRGLSPMFVFNSKDGGILIFDRNMEISKLDPKMGAGCSTTPLSASRLPQTPLKTGISKISQIDDTVIWGIKNTRVSSNTTNLSLITMCP